MKKVWRGIWESLCFKTWHSYWSKIEFCLKVWYFLPLKSIKWVISSFSPVSMITDSGNKLSSLPKLSQLFYLLSIFSVILRIFLKWVLNTSLYQLIEVSMWDETNLSFLSSPFHILGLYSSSRGYTFQQCKDSYLRDNRLKEKWGRILTILKVLALWTLFQTLNLPFCSVFRLFSDREQQVSLRDALSLKR